MYQLSRRLLSGLTIVLSAPALIGFSVAIGLASALHFWIATFGTSLPVSSGLLLATALFWWIACRCGVRQSVSPRMVWAAFAVWTVGLPMFADLAATLLGFAPLAWLENDRALIVFSTLCGSIVLGVPISLGFVVVRRAAQSTRTPAGVVIAAVAGVLLFTFVMAPLVGVYASSLIGLAVGIAGVWRLQTQLCGDNVSSPARQTAIHHGAVNWLSLPVLLLSGIVLAGLYRVSQQLLPGAEYIVFSVLGFACGTTAVGFLIGNEWTLRIRSRQFQLPGLAVPNAMLVIAVVGIAGLVSFSSLIWPALTLNARLSSVPLLMAARVSMLLVFAVPFFVAVGRVAASDGISNRRPESLSALFLGFTIGLWLSSGAVEVRLLLLAGGAGVGFFAVMATIASARLRRSRWQYARLVVCGLMIGGSAKFIDQYQPATSAQMLFSSRVAMASQRDDSSDILFALDDARLLASQETQAGVRTAWRIRGSQIQFRTNGVMDGFSGTAPSVCPKHSAEVLPAVIPMALHDRPERVATLGLGSGEILNAVMKFPVIEVHSVAVEESRRSILVELNALTTDVMDDDRLVEHFVDPVIGIRALPAELDIIISNPPDSSCPHGVSHFTRTFYRQAADRLARNGIFCQRFRQVDYGPSPFETVMATLHDVFQDVIAIEASAGDMVLVATNAKTGLIRDGLIARLQRPQVLTALQAAGWDWSLILSQPALRLNSDEPSESAACVNTVANGSFAFRLPQEMMRWGNKMLELHNQLASRTHQLMTWVPDTEDIMEASKRIGESVELHEIIAGFPDEPWSYRQTLKARMTRQPRPPVEVVEDGRIKQKAHPIDKRRIDYLRALSKAIKTLDPESVAAVLKFTEPYDPMISYFIHHEVTRLYARLPEPDYHAEFSHLLHTIYFADAADRSVRNASRAINLLADHPEMYAASQDRWDQMNALLQVLVYRWENRNTIEARSSQIALNDVECSLNALDTGISQLRAWSADADVNSSLVEARATYLARSLLRPLGTYRGKLLEHYQKSRRLAEKRRDKDLSPSAN
jgi:hypothetical protein